MPLLQPRGIDGPRRVRVPHSEIRVVARGDSALTVAEAGKSRGKKTIAAGDLADVFGIEMAETETPTDASPALWLAETEAIPERVDGD